MSEYLSVRGTGTDIYEEKRSVFYGFASPVKTEEEALSFLREIKARYPDARHHVYAYLLRENSLMRYSDDHEPQGTAGMPVLDVIRKNGCTDVIVVVVRYFGGTLLGTGGLVRAYTAAAKGALEHAEIVCFSEQTVCQVICSYSDFQKLQFFLESKQISLQAPRYAESISFEFYIPNANVDAISKEIADLTGGRASISPIRTEYCISG